MFVHHEPILWRWSLAIDQRFSHVSKVIERDQGHETSEDKKSSQRERKIKESNWLKIVKIYEV